MEAAHFEGSAHLLLGILPPLADGDVAHLIGQRLGGNVGGVAQQLAVDHRGALDRLLPQKGAGLFQRPAQRIQAGVHHQPCCHEALHLGMAVQLEPRDHAHLASQRGGIHGPSLDGGRRHQEALQRVHRGYLVLKRHLQVMARQQLVADQVGRADERAAARVTPVVAVAAHGLRRRGALEVTEGAKRLGEPLYEYITRLKEAGLASLPGTAAEILDDDVRAILCPDKINTEEWLECHQVAHEAGLRSNITIMFGSVEQPHSWAKHIVRTRALQEITGGFTEFVGLPFVHMASPIYLQRKSRRGPTFRETLLMHAIARIAYRGLIDNIQVSWTKIGRDGATQLLQAGCNDLGGTLMDENISRAAGASHGTKMTEASFREISAPLGRTLRQRNTVYERPDREPAVISV